MDFEESMNALSISREKTKGAKNMPKGKNAKIGTVPTGVFMSAI